MMKRVVTVLLAMVLSLCCASCGIQVKSEQEPRVSSMRSICELATMECYYHNVAKYNEKGSLWKKDKHFWIEYGGVVKVGVDASKISIMIDGDSVEITIPDAKVFGCKVDENTLTEDSFFVDKDSAKITADDEQKAYEEAQEKMYQQAANDSALLANAQQRAQTLMEEYVNNIGEATGNTYKVTWKYIDASNPILTGNDSAEES